MLAAAKYRFRSRWELPNLASDVYDALASPTDYPSWWPQFKEVRRIDEAHHWMVVRSFLPYYISYLLVPEIADRERGVLQARVDGDIVGRIRWQIAPGGRGSLVQFEERVRTQVDLLNLFAPIARLGFEANHRLMMRDGLVGLRGYLAGDPALRGERGRWHHR